MIRAEGKGFGPLKSKLAKLSQESAWITPLVRKATLYVHSQVPGYPSPPPASRYVRTGTLGRSITTKVTSLSGNEVAGFIGTNTPYAPYVIDEKRQARTHRGRWWTLQGVVDKAAPAVRAIFEAGIRALVRSKTGP